MAHRDPLSPTPMPTILGYGIAVLSVAIAVVLDFFVLRQFEAVLTPFLFAVAATVWYAGTGPGVLAIVLSVLSLNYFFLPPGFSFSPISYADFVYLAFCVVCASAVGWVSAVRRRAERELRRAHEELEATVAERTASLRRSEAYLAEAQRLSHCGVTAYKGSTVFYGSEEIYRIWGFDPAQGVPNRKAVLQRIHPDDRDRLNAVVERALVEKKRYSAAYRIVLPDGTVKHLESVGQPVFSTNGELVEVIATQIDVTERKRAEDALRESEAKIRRLVDSNIIGIFVWDFDGRILEANDEFLRIVSYDREDLVSGRIRWADLTPPDWRDRNNARIDQQKNSGRFEPFEKEFTRKDGSRVPILIGGATFEEGGSQGVAFVLDLTERKRVEDALREREVQLAEARRELRQMIDTIPIPVASYSPDARRDFVNAAWKQYTGLSDEAARGTEWSVVAHPDDTAGGNKMWRDALATGEPWHTEERVRRADGQYRWFAIDRVAARDENGKIIKWYGTAYDIEDRKCAEDALRESEYKLRQIIDTIPAHVVRYQPDGAADFMNWTFSEFVGPGVGFDNLGSVVHPEDYPKRSRDWETHVAAAEPYDIEMRLRRADGVYRWHRSRRVPLRDANGAIVNWYGAGHDVDDQKRAEQALRVSEAKFRDYAESASDWYWETDPDHKFTRLTEDERRLALGLATVSRIGVARWEFATDVQSEPEKWELHRSMLKARQPFRDFVYRATHSDGSVVYNKISGKPVFDANGEFHGYRGTGADVTALRMAEEEARENEQRYRKAELDLAHANRVATMGQLTASITHEVNQPITAAVTYALAARRFLSAKPPNLREVDEALSLIVKEGNRAGEVVGRVRALIKKAPARKDAVEINVAVLEVIALTRREAANNGISVQTQLAEGLPRVQGDRVQLQQVLLNLIINAIEAMRDCSEGERELLVNSCDGPDGVSVEVRDSGPGFAAADLDRVFEAFYSTKPNGVGLGLSICRSIVEAHHGRLWASPNVPRGAIFRFTVPAHSAAGS
ncbi:PAS domain S-box protein [Bradyrhizobium sp. LTSPM299]|uniref:PAS domain S-box protein n=1 Tax=Bradyrhizobium sp. LTSPM299 TaxID=1619233 RepID=UPI000B0FE301|nr:PAS domain S-box protein [Bradyrhizobium sp. LTSPM299]